MDAPHQSHLAAPANAGATHVSVEVSRKLGQPRDPLKALAAIFAEALAARLAAGDPTDIIVQLARSVGRRKRGISVAKLIDQFLMHVRSYYRLSDGTPTGEINNYESALKILRKAYGRTPAEEFRPLKLKAVREKMIEKGWCRKHVNAQVGRVKRMFKWAVENELLSADRHHALQAVEGLKRGRTAARDPDPVKPVPEELVTATLPFVSPQIAAMIRLQLLTGMRPGEVCIMRTCDVNRSDDIWVYRPSRHKNEHHAHERLIFIGPRAQEILDPFLRETEPQAFLFSAADAEEEWRRLKHAARKTPLNQGNYPGNRTKRRPRVKPGARYRRDSYTRAISRACDVAFPAPPGATPEQAAAWRKQHHWHPHQLRHNSATRLRKEFGIDAAQVILGHKTLAITAIYAEKDTEEAMEIMRKIG